MRSPAGAGEGAHRPRSPGLPLGGGDTERCPQPGVHERGSPGPRTGLCFPPGVSPLSPGRGEHRGAAGGGGDAAPLRFPSPCWGTGSGPPFLRRVREGISLRRNKSRDSSLLLFGNASLGSEPPASTRSVQAEARHLGEKRCWPLGDFFLPLGRWFIYFYFYYYYHFYYYLGRSLSRTRTKWLLGTSQSSGERSGERAGGSGGRSGQSPEAASARPHLGDREGRGGGAPGWGAPGTALPCTHRQNNGGKRPPGPRPGLAEKDGEKKILK